MASQYVLARLILLGLYGLAQGFLMASRKSSGSDITLVGFATGGGSDPSDLPTDSSVSVDVDATSVSSDSFDTDLQPDSSDSLVITMDPPPDHQHAVDTTTSADTTTLPPDDAQRIQEHSRRDFLQRSALAFGSSVVVGGTAIVASTTTKHTSATPTRQVVPLNLTLVIQETKVNVTYESFRTLRFLDPTTLQKKETLKLPSWIPPNLLPPVTRVVQDTSDAEILTAAILAGSAVEMMRTTILYPLLTLKTRIQTDIQKRQRKLSRNVQKKRLHLRQRLRVLHLNIRRHFREGDLYAGIVPALLISVPATGVYYGVRDVAKRALLMPHGLPGVAVAVGAALMADIVSLIIRTPADTLSIRLQVASGEESHHHNESNDQDDSSREQRLDHAVGDWLLESVERLPAVILTDLPYVLLRIGLNSALIQGTLDVGHYELIAVSTAILCGIVTTPFDVARTRILLDSDDDPKNGIDGGSGEGLLRTFQTIIRESDDGWANLFRGWAERALYLGIGRAWLEPLQILGYIALRDTIILDWFD